MEKKQSDRATTSKDAQIRTSQRPTLPTFTKIISSQSALNNLASKIPPSPTLSSTATPTLGQIGKQGSINFRHSQLYDSDADDQTFLLRTPSLRSHKFIIIPATSSLEKGKQISRPLSTTSLTSLQKFPLRSPTNQNLNELIATTTAITTTTTSAPLTSSSKTSVNKLRLQSQPTTTTTSPTLLSRSDVIHHQLNMTESKRLKTTAATTTTAMTASSNVNTSVKFTIEDYESDNATDAITIATTINTTAAPTTMTTSSSSTLDAFYSLNMPAITSIYSASNNNSCTLPSQSTSRQLLLSSSSSASVSPSVLTLSRSKLSPSVRPVSALLASTSFNHNNFFNSSIDSANGAPSLGIGLRPRYNRDSSMRSIVSAFGSIFNFITFYLCRTTY